MSGTSSSILPLLMSDLQKCTGTRPVCDQCSQMKRVHECKYDDSSKKSRTQLLREKVMVLEAKLRDLESESSYTPQGMSPLSLSDSSGDSLEHCPEPSLSAEMHNTLYVAPENILLCSD